MRFPLRGKRRHRRDADFDAAVALIIGLAAFGRAFQLRFAITQRRHPRALDAAAGEIVGDRGGAAFGQALVIGFAAGRIGVAIDVDIGARIFGERRGDIVERAAELRFHERAVIVESDVAGHVEHELVALALDVDAGARGAFAQLLFLLVHIIADARAGDLTAPPVALREALAAVLARHAERGRTLQGALAEVEERARAATASAAGEDAARRETAALRRNYGALEQQLEAARAQAAGGARQAAAAARESDLGLASLKQKVAAQAHQLRAREGEGFARVASTRDRSID